MDKESLTRRNSKKRMSPIFDYLYLVRYNHHASMSADELRRRGQLVSGYDEYDEDAHKNMLTTMLSIDAMFELHRKRNIGITVINRKDTVKIYEAIQEHIKAWVERLQTAVNVKKEIVKDLIDLDRFAGIVYEHAEPIFSEKQRQIAEHGDFADFGFLNAFDFIDTRKKKGEKENFFFTEKDERAVTTSTPRSGFEEVLNRHADQLRLWDNQE